MKCKHKRVRIFRHLANIDHVVTQTFCVDCGKQVAGYTGPKAEKVTA